MDAEPRRINKIMKYPTLLGDPDYWHCKKVQNKQYMLARIELNKDDIVGLEDPSFFASIGPPSCCECNGDLAAKGETLYREAHEGVREQRYCSTECRN